MKSLVSSIVLITTVAFAGGLCSAQELDKAEFLAEFKRHDAELMKSFVLEGETTVPETGLDTACDSGTRYFVQLVADGESTGSLTRFKALPEGLRYVEGLRRADYFPGPDRMGFWISNAEVWLANAKENREARANQTALVDRENKSSLVDKVWVQLTRFPLEERDRPALRFRQTMYAAGRMVAEEIQKIDELTLLEDGRYRLKGIGRHRCDIEIDVPNGYLVRRGSVGPFEITTEGTVRAGDATVAKSGTLRHGKDFEVVVKIDSLSLEPREAIGKVTAELQRLSGDPDRRVRDDAANPRIEEAYKDGVLDYRFEGGKLVAGKSFEQQELQKKRAEIKVTYRYIYIAGGERPAKSGRPQRTMEEAKAIAAKVRAQLVEDRNRFKELALAHSDYKDANLGSFETRSITSLAPSIAEVVEKMAEGSLSEVIEMEGGCVVVEMAKMGREP